MKDKKKNKESEQSVRESALDKTLADSFPTSDPPSTIPNPEDRDTTGANHDGVVPDPEQYRKP